MTPKGWHRIVDYWEEHGFHHVRLEPAFPGLRAQEFKTKRDRIGRELARAYHEQIPVVLVTAGEWIEAAELLPTNYEVDDVSPDELTARR